MTLADPYYLQQLKHREKEGEAEKNLMNTCGLGSDFTLKGNGVEKEYIERR